MATVALAAGAAVLQPMFNQSLGSLPGVLNSLVQLGQVQISDIVPLENSAMEAVAVLLVVSSTAIDETTLKEMTVLEENEPKDPFATESELTRVSDPVARASNLERFLSDVESELEGVPRDLFGATGDLSASCPRGGLGQADTPRVPSIVDTSGNRSRSNVNFDSAAASATTPPDGPTTRGGSPGQGRLGGALFSTPTAEPAANHLREAAAVCGVLFVSAAVLGWGAVQARRRSGRPRLMVRPMPTFVGPPR